MAAKRVRVAHDSLDCVAKPAVIHRKPCGRFFICFIKTGLGLESTDYWIEDSIGSMIEPNESVYPTPQEISRSLG